jgi:glucose/arabinose dehydrogenase
MTQRHPRAALSATVGLIMALAAILPAAAPVAAHDPLTARPSDRSIDLIEPTALGANQLTVVKVTGGLSSPVGVTHAGDGSGRLFVVQQGGRVRVVKNRQLQSGSFLDVSSIVTFGGERGLLGLAFHPQFTVNGYVYIYYAAKTAPGRAGKTGDIVVARLTAPGPGHTSAPLSSLKEMLIMDHSQYTNHFGGALAFGPDGYLYIGTGDGGGAGDPNANAQNLKSLFGKILRIDVDGTGHGVGGTGHGVPADNPFVADPDPKVDSEIWDYGLRNPWRISFDRTTHNLFIGDVGQDRYEEIDRELDSSTGGLNYGWRVMEGTHCYPSGDSCNKTGKVLPVAEYNHSLGCSVTGGYVYRGAHRDLQGLYVYGDFCSGRLWTMNEDGTGETLRRDTALAITSFGENEAGELFVTDLNGALYRVIAPEFKDIATSTFIDDIHWLFYQGITGGCGSGNFCPKASVTRVQMAQFLVRAFHYPAATQDYFFDDNGISGENSINSLREANITGGCAPGRFCPRANVTRAQMAIFLAKALNLPATTTDYFDDDDGKTGESSINRMAAAGLTGGCAPRKYCPTANVTREQMAAFLRRALT